MTNATPGHVFISYSRKQQPYARALADHLIAHGFNVWIDDRIDYGDYWWQAIVRGIEECAALAVIMTPDSESSRWVQREVLLADGQHKPIFPLLLEGRNWPLFVDRQYVDVRSGLLPPDDFLERLAEVVPHTPSGQTPHVVTPPAQAAPPAASPPPPARPQMPDIPPVAGALQRHIGDFAARLLEGRALLAAGITTLAWVVGFALSYGLTTYTTADLTLGAIGGLGTGIGLRLLLPERLSWQRVGVIAAGWAVITGAYIFLNDAPLFMVYTLVGVAGGAVTSVVVATTNGARGGGRALLVAALFGLIWFTAGTIDPEMGNLFNIDLYSDWRHLFFSVIAGVGMSVVLVWYARGQAGVTQPRQAASPAARPVRPDMGLVAGGWQGHIGGFAARLLERRALLALGVTTIAWVVGYLISGIWNWSPMDAVSGLIGGVGVGLAVKLLARTLAWWRVGAIAAGWGLATGVVITLALVGAGGLLPAFLVGAVGGGLTAFFTETQWRSSVRLSALLLTCFALGMAWLLGRVLGAYVDSSAFADLVLFVLVGVASGVSAVWLSSSQPGVTQP